ncbi:MAG: DUF349 domain-containing protein [Bacteroidetes bacterium]|nr:DUF349 domain-containing protein [Bacteroidota bacterium]
MDKNIDLSKNLKTKQDLINKLKELINLDIKMNEKYLGFKKIQNDWFKTGSVPRANNTIIWNTFQHHIKNFYDYLHLNRKFKEIDVKYNLEQKKETIEQAKKLIDSEDKIRAIKYFERLNKKWKFEIGPTKKEDEIRLKKEFYSVGELILENRKEFDKNKYSILNDNYLKKINLLKEIENLIEKEGNSTKEWQTKIKSFDRIKSEIETSGPIPIKEKKKYWSNYKNIIRLFYSKKNEYFKNLKITYKENISKQEEIIKKAENLDSIENLEKNKKEIIILQKNWKIIKPIPYKVNEKNWKLFKSICDKFFNKIDEIKIIKSKELIKNETEQNKILNKIENFDLANDINTLIDEWKEVGEISSINESVFNKKIKKVFKESGLTKNESTEKLLKIKISSMNQTQKDSEIYSLNKKLELLKKELTILENNISFFNDNSKENKMLDNSRNEIKKKKIEIEFIIQQKYILKK